MLPFYKQNTVESHEQIAQQDDVKEYLEKNEKPSTEGKKDKKGKRKPKKGKKRKMNRKKTTQFRTTDMSIEEEGLASLFIAQNDQG